MSRGITIAGLVLGFVVANAQAQTPQPAQQTDQQSNQAPSVQDAQPTATPSGQNSKTVPISGIDSDAVSNSGRSSKIVGSSVYKADVSIGTINDILVDFNSGQIAGVVLSVGGFLGLGDKLVAVPSKDILVDKEAKFTTTLTKEQLTSAPAFHFGK